MKVLFIEQVFKTLSKCWIELLLENSSWTLHLYVNNSSPQNKQKRGKKKKHHALASIIIPLLFYQLCVLLQHLRRPSVTSKQNTMIISALAFMIFTGLYWLKQTSSFTLHLWDPSHLQAECCIAEVDALLCWVSKSCWEAPNTAAATTLSEHIFLQPFKWVASCAGETT